MRIDWDRVSKTRVALYREEDGSCPFIEWFDKLPVKAPDKCYLRLERLREIGRELRRPEADFLRDGIYELRASLGGVDYRIPYFFHVEPSRVEAQFRKLLIINKLVALTGIEGV